MPALFQGPSTLTRGPCAAAYNQYRRNSTYGTDSGLPGVTVRRVETALAGFILLSISNLLLLAVLGTAPTVTNNTYNNKEVTSTRGPQMTQMQPTTTGAAYPTTGAAYPTTAATPAQGGMMGAGQTVV